MEPFFAGNSECAARSIRGCDGRASTLKRNSMNLSRQAALAAASLLSAIIAVPPAVLADNASGQQDTADKDKKHKGEHEKGGAEKKASPQAKPHGGERPHAERPNSGFGQQPHPQQRGGFGNTRPAHQPALAPSNRQPDAVKEHPRSPANAAPKTPPARPPVINAAPKEAAPTEKNAGEHGKHDQRHAGDKDNRTPPPGAKPAVINPTTNNSAGEHGRHDQRRAGDKDNRPSPPGAKPDVVNPTTNNSAGEPGRHDQRHFGDKSRPPAPGTNPAVVNPTNNPAARGRPGSPTIDANAPRSGPTPPRPLPPAEARKRFDNLRKTRTEKVEGNKTFIKEGDRTIIKQNNRIIIQHDETERLRRVDPHARFERGKNGANIAVIDRPGGVKIYSETDANGHLLRRYRRGPDGRDVIIIDNRRRRHGGGIGRDIATGIGIGVGVAAGAAILNSVVDVPPPRVRIPRNQYIVDYDGASDEDVYDALSAPPVEDFRDRYTLDEIRATASLRDRMRRVDLDDINFEFGSWEVDPSEYNKLDRVARAMKRVIRRNPNEVFMIEGYTDAVGSPEDNLSLSDRRAESVAEVLTEEFQVPFENLVTQGYGEDYLKVPTDQPERLNRRVAVRRITPLLARGDAPGAAPPPPRRDDRGPPPEERYEQVPGGDDPD
jgi:outer membrane protein OmpA-like peptidoglycan-associated protein